MYESIVTSVILTLGFSIIGLAYAWATVQPGHTLFQRIGDGLHVVMSFAMIVMAWDARMVIFPASVQLVVFGAATVYFFVLTVMSLWRRAAIDAAWQAFHALMMLAMVIMAEVMRPMAMPMPSHDSMGAMGDMPTSMISPMLLTACGAFFAVASLVLAVLLIVRLQRGRASHTEATITAHAQHGSDARLALVLLMTIFMGLGFTLG